MLCPECKTYSMYLQDHCEACGRWNPDGYCICGKITKVVDQQCYNCGFVLCAFLKAGIDSQRSLKQEYTKEYDIMEDIKFSGARGHYGGLSNFAAYPIAMDDVIWPTAEHYFQAQKFDEESYREMIRSASSPKEAKQLGRSKMGSIRGNWEREKDHVMLKVVLAKFSQHEELKDLLFSTGDARIIEYSKYDNYWGDGGDGSGKNHLGYILMQVRDMLWNEKSIIDALK